MKKIWTIITVFIFLIIPLERVKAQMIVELGAATQMIMEKTKLEQIVYYVQMVEQQIQSVKNTYDQLEAAVRAEERAIQNLKGITNVDSYGDFMNWYNSQLYLERQAENRFRNIGVEIGGVNYKLDEIEEIPGGLKEAYYWDTFSPAQRREMWMNLGLTPANYVYQQTWKAREKEKFRQIITNRDMTREDNQAAYERYGKILEEARKEEMGLLQALLDLSVDTNHAIRKGNEDAAVVAEWEASQNRLNNTPYSSPGISDTWGRELFGSITEEQGFFID